MKRKIFIFYLIACQLILLSCSRQLYPDHTFPNINSPHENRKLQEFMDGGVEKRINAHSANAGEVIITARKYLGVPHCMGGTTMKCMDCSGLLVTVFAQHGIKLPRNSEDQARHGTIITDIGKLRQGDLVFFIRSYKTTRFITHSGIYLGNNEFIHASSSRGVTITTIHDPWWNEKFIFGTRVF